MNSGAGRIVLGVVLLIGGGVLLLGTLRNPVFDPATGLRSSVDEGTAAVEVFAAGQYALYLESEDCSTAEIELSRVGEPSVSLTALADPRFQSYRYEGLCGQPVGVATISDAGLWTAALTAPDGNLVLYPADEPPINVDWELSWVFVPMLIAGTAVLALGLLERNRWRRALRDVAA